ncbi:hypothetical protein PLICRDRAFT_43143 [Plicaturopsis crispa FD-325 SS-3]|nr:hypothetical protein PLICRDRAFT_43143 [Plicaturopsis crispa FD-325 SS-3]
MRPSSPNTPRAPGSPSMSRSMRNSNSMQNPRLSPDQLFDLARRSSQPSTAPEPANFTPLADDVYLPFVDRPGEVAALINSAPSSKLFSLLAQTFTPFTASPRPVPDSPATPADVDLKALPDDATKWTYAQLVAHLTRITREEVPDAPWTKRARVCIRTHSELIWERVKAALGVPPELDGDGEESEDDKSDAELEVLRRKWDEAENDAGEQVLHSPASLEPSSAGVLREDTGVFIEPLYASSTSASSSSALTSPSTNPYFSPGFAGGHGGSPSGHIRYNHGYGTPPLVSPGGITPLSLPPGVGYDQKQLGAESPQQLGDIGEEEEEDNGAMSRQLSTDTARQGPGGDSERQSSGETTTAVPSPLNTCTDVTESGTDETLHGTQIEEQIRGLRISTAPTSPHMSTRPMPLSQNRPSSEHNVRPPLEQGVRATSEPSHESIGLKKRSGSAGSLSSLSSFGGYAGAGGGAYRAPPSHLSQSSVGHNVHSWVRTQSLSAGSHHSRADIDDADTDGGYNPVGDRAPGNPLFPSNFARLALGPTLSAKERPPPSA